jgi:hypothetical protein
LDEEFEHAWASVAKDVFGTMRDDLKSQYDQARGLMKINTILKQKLAT